MLSSSIIIPRVVGKGDAVRARVRGSIKEYVVGFRDPSVIDRLEGIGRIDGNRVAVRVDGDCKKIRDIKDVWKHAVAYSNGRLPASVIEGVSVVVGKAALKIGEGVDLADGQAVHMYSAMRWPMKEGVGLVLLGGWHKQDEGGLIEAVVIDPVNGSVMSGGGWLEEVF